MGSAGPIKIPQMKIPFDITPVIPHGGEVNFQVGPFQYPDLSVPLLSSITSHMEAHAKAAPPIVSCSGSDAHFKNAVIDVSPAQPKKGSDVTITFSGDLDEAVSAGEIELDINLVITTLSLKIPFTNLGTATPATSGIKAVIGPFTLPDIPLIPNVKGTVKVSEQNGEEVLCENFNMPIADAVEV